MSGQLKTIRHCPRSLARGLWLFCFLFLFPGMLVVACRATSGAREEEHIQVEVRAVSFDPTVNSPVVILQNKEQTKAIPIWVGMSEAQAIYLELQGKAAPRPLTHDLMKTILEQTGVRCEKVVVSELRQNTYYASIYLVTAEKPLKIDSRPSDAIALALRFHRPIFVAKSLFDGAFSPETPEAKLAPTSVTVAGVTVQNLTAALAAYFHLPENSGVVVTDATEEGGDNSLQRGDVVTAVEGESIHDVDEFRDSVSKEKRATVTLRVQRDGREQSVRLLPTEE